MSFTTIAIVLTLLLSTSAFGLMRNKKPATAVVKLFLILQFALSGATLLAVILKNVDAFPSYWFFSPALELSLAVFLSAAYAASCLITTYHSRYDLSRFLLIINILPLAALLQLSYGEVESGFLANPWQTYDFQWFFGLTILKSIGWTTILVLTAHALKNAMTGEQWIPKSVRFLAWSVVGQFGVLLGFDLVLGYLFSGGTLWDWNSQEMVFLAIWLIGMGLTEAIRLNQWKPLSTWLLTACIGGLLLALFLGFGLRLEHGHELWLTIIFLPSALVGFLIFNSLRITGATSRTNDPLWSRQFWQYVLVLVALATSGLLLYKTAFPPQPDEFAVDYSASFSSWILPLGIIILIMFIITQLTNYGGSDAHGTLKRRIIPGILTVITVGILFALDAFPLDEIGHTILLISSLLIVFTSVFHFRENAGRGLLLIGLGIFLAGALWHSDRSEIISRNVLGNLAELDMNGLSNETDMLLFKGDTLPMGEYFVLYTDFFRPDSTVINVSLELFDVKPKQYKEGDLIWMMSDMFRCMEPHTAGKTFLEHMESHWSQVPYPNERQKGSAQLWMHGRPGEKIHQLQPSYWQQGPGYGSIAHGFTSDLGANVMFSELMFTSADNDGYYPARYHVLKPQNTIRLSNGYVTGDWYTLADSARTQLVDLIVHTSPSDSTEVITTAPFSEGDKSMELSAIGARVNQAYVDERANLHLAIQEHISAKKDFIILRAEKLPFVNLVWLGGLLIIAGSLWSNRKSQNG